MVCLIQGYYAIAVESPASLRCEERRSAWQVSFPGAELELDGHFSSASTPKRVLAVLRLLAQQMERPSDQPEIEVSIFYNHQITTTYSNIICNINIPYSEFY
jgi:hypothetical protein